MNTSSSSTSNAYQNPPIIRISTFPRAVVDRKPDDQSLESLQRSNFLLYPTQQTSNSSSTSSTPSLSPTIVSSATVPQIVNILNPLLTSIALPNTANNNLSNASSGIHPNAKKCTFHRQCLHAQQQQQQPAGQQQPQQQINQQQYNNQISQIQQQSQLLQQQLQQQQQQQQARINNQPAVNRNSTQANRDAISSNVQPPQFNAALLQDRYLLLDMVDGSSFYKCIDIQTQKVLACKVCNELISNLNITFTQILNYLLLLLLSISIFFPIRRSQRRQTRAEKGSANEI